MDQKAGGPGALAQERGLQKVDVGSALRAVRLSWKGFGLRSPRALTWEKLQSACKHLFWSILKDLGCP